MKSLIGLHNGLEKKKKNVLELNYFQINGTQKKKKNQLNYDSLSFSFRMQQFSLA